MFRPKLVGVWFLPTARLTGRRAGVKARSSTKGVYNKITKTKKP